LSENEILEPVVIPTAELKIVLDWVQSEQIRILNSDRTLARKRIHKVDYLTDIRENLVHLREQAEYDNREVKTLNYFTGQRIEYERERVAAETKKCVSFVECTCDKKH
jgi:hypothetical protein